MGSDTSSDGRSSWRTHLALTSQLIRSEAKVEILEGSISQAAASAPILLKCRRVVLAIDMDCFYAQCEELRFPELRGQPIGVQQKSLVITSNYAARKFGIEKGDSLRVVREKCPQITICNGEDLGFYSEVSQRVFDVVSHWTPQVEKLGLDEVFLDITAAVDERLAAEEHDMTMEGPSVVYPETEPGGVAKCVLGDLPKGDAFNCLRRLDIGAAICREIREAIHREVGVTSSAGISVSKMLAKLVASWKKPAAQTLFWPTESSLSRLLPDCLPVQRIPGVGFSSTQKCRELDIVSIGDFLAACKGQIETEGRTLLASKFDDKALANMRSLFLGIDESDVRSTGAPKSCSAEDSFWSSPLCSEADVVESLKALARKLLGKIRTEERRFGVRDIPTFAVSLRHAPKAGEGERGTRLRKQVPLDGSLRLSGSHDSSISASDDEPKAKKLAERALNLFRKLVPEGSEPFALNILNLQVQFGEAYVASQQRLKFAKRADPSEPSQQVSAAEPRGSGQTSDVTLEGMRGTSRDVGSRVDLLAEVCVSDSEAEETLARHGSSADVKTGETLEAWSASLVAMGFSQPEIEAALRRSPNDIQAVVDDILNARAAGNTEPACALKRSTEGSLQTSSDERPAKRLSSQHARSSCEGMHGESQVHTITID